jgi:hypothetical protein
VNLDTIAIKGFIFFCFVNFNKMSRALILALLIGCLVNILSGQDSTSKKKKFGMGCGGVELGYGQMDISKLQIFTPEGTDALSRRQLIIGGTGHAIIDKLVIGGTGFTVIGDEIKTDSNRTSLSGGMGTFDFGYLIYNSSNLKIYPMVGLGGGGYGLLSTTTKNINANQISRNSGREISISHGSFIIDFSLNFNLMPAPQFNKEENSYGGFMTGLKLGYTYSLPNNDWRYSGGYISGGPKFGVNLFYLKLIIGGFGSNTK